MSEADLSPRDVAVRALRDRAGNVSARLERLLKRARLDDKDRRLARELAMGVVRRRGTLEAILRAFLAKPDRKLPMPLKEILMVGLYQTVFLQRVPDFAAVNEAVDQAIRSGHKRQSGFVNGLLRRVVRSLSEEVSGKCPASPQAVPISPDSYRLLDRPAFEDPDANASGYLAGAYSLPQALAERWLDARGTVASVAELAMHACTRPPVILRVNRLKASVDDTVSALVAEGLTARRHVNGLSVVVEGRMELSRLSAFANGWIQVQDPTASGVSLTARPKAGMKVLDFCAAPGTKTTHLAELMDNRGEIVAVDVSRKKLARIDSNCARMGISIVTTMLAEHAGSLAPASFDLALVDVPCSNTGVLARRPEAKWRFDERKLSKLTGDQLLLVVSAARLVKPGGRLIYSTCSIEPEECNRLAASAARKYPALQLIDAKLTLPSGAADPTAWCDGGYHAVFQVD